MINMQFRKSVPADAMMIGKVLSRSYNMSNILEGARTFCDETERGFNYIVAEEENHVVGVASWVAHGLPKHGLCEMDRLAVLPAYRGRGIATHIFNFLLDDATAFYESQGSRLRKLYLLTHATNETAQSLYRKLDFVHEATLRNHYYEGVDEYVFSMFPERQHHKKEEAPTSR